MVIINMHEYLSIYVLLFVSDKREEENLCLCAIYYVLTLYVNIDNNWVRLRLIYSYQDAIWTTQESWVAPADLVVDQWCSDGVLFLQNNIYVALENLLANYNNNNNYRSRKPEFYIRAFFGCKRPWTQRTRRKTIQIHLDPCILYKYYIGIIYINTCIHVYIMGRGYLVFKYLAIEPLGLGGWQRLFYFWYE